LKEDWSLRHVENFYKTYTESTATAPGAGEHGAGEQGAQSPSSAPLLYSEQGHRLVTHGNRLASAGAEEKAQLARLLRSLLECLQAANG
jgi:hypothetical protein